MKTEELKALIENYNESCVLQMTLSSNRHGYQMLRAIKNYVDQGRIIFENDLLLTALIFSPEWYRFSLDFSMRFTTWELWSEVRFWRLVEAGVEHIKVINPTDQK